jgi:predicted kinase
VTHIEGAVALAFCFQVLCCEAAERLEHGAKVLLDARLESGEMLELQVVVLALDAVYAQLQHLGQIPAVFDALLVEVVREDAQLRALARQLRDLDVVALEPDTNSGKSVP